MNKTCTTCKFEPDWEEEFKGCGWFYGKCKKVPTFFQEGDLHKGSSGKITYERGARMAMFDEIKDCNLWEAK